MDDRTDSELIAGHADPLGLVVRVLRETGFVVDDVQRGPTYALVKCHLVDVYGLLIPYRFVPVDVVDPINGRLDPVSAGAIIRERETDHISTLVIGDSGDGPLPALPWPTFVDRCRLLPTPNEVAHIARGA